MQTWTIELTGGTKILSRGEAEGGFKYLGSRFGVVLAFVFFSAKSLFFSFADALRLQ
jgi:hypothetical protein